MNNVEKRIAYELKDEQYNLSYQENFAVVDLYKEDDQFTFKLKFYPFKPPVAFYKNGKKINYNVQTIPYQLLNNYMKTYKECPCCVSILCPSNWNPTYKLQDMGIKSDTPAFARAQAIIDSIADVMCDMRECVVDEVTV